MRCAKNKWFQKNEDETEKSKNGNKIVWQCIQDIGDEIGDVCKSVGLEQE